MPREMLLKLYFMKCSGRKVSQSILALRDFLFLMKNLAHPATRRRGDVVTTSLCTSQRRRRYVSNETPNNVSVERCQDISVVGLFNVLLVCCDDVSWGRNTTSPQYVSTTPQTSLK